MYSGTMIKLQDFVGENIAYSGYKVMGRMNGRFLRVISRIQTALNSAQLNVHFFEFLNTDWDVYQVLTNMVVTYNGYS